MLRTFALKFGRLVLVVLVVTFMTFALTKLQPGDPVSKIIPFGTVPSHEKLEYYASVRCTEVVLRLESYDRDGALRQLDDLGQYLTR